MARPINVDMNLDSTKFERGMKAAERTGIASSNRLVGAISSIGTAFTLMTGPIGLATAAITGLVAGTKFMINADETIGKTTQLFNYLAQSIGTTGDVLLKELRPQVKGLLSDLELMKATNDAIRLGIDKDMIPVMVKFANINKEAGTTTAEAMQQLISAVGRGSTELFDNFGITLKAAAAQEQYAQSIGKTVNQLTAEQKANAMKIAGLAKIAEKVEDMGDRVFTNADRWKAWGNGIKNMLFWLYNNAINPVFTWWTDWIDAVLYKVGSAGTAMKGFARIMKSLMPGGESPGEVIDATVKEMQRRADERMKYIQDRTAYRESLKTGENIPDYQKTAAAVTGERTQGEQDVSTVKAAEEQGKKLLNIRKKVADKDKAMLRKWYDTRKQLLEDDIENQLQLDYEGFELKEEQLNMWYEKEKELRLQHNVDLDTLDAEYAERKAEIDAERKQAEIEREEAYYAQLLSTQESFYNNADNLFVSFAENRAKIAQVIKGIRQGELSNEEMFQKGYEGLLQHAPAVFGETGQKLVAVMQAVESAKALMSVYSGAAQAMAQLPFPANIAAAAAIVGTGLGYVAQLKQAASSFGGGGGSTATASAGGGGGVTGSAMSTVDTANQTALMADRADQPKGELIINIQGDILNEDYVELLSEKLSEAVQDRNVILKASEARSIRNL